MLVENKLKLDNSYQKKIILLFCYSRSGGTLLSQLLNSNREIALLSEINSRISVSPSHKVMPTAEVLKEQFSQWHNFTPKGETIIEILDDVFNSGDFNRKKIILRDWSFVDFNPSEFNNFSPSNKMNLLEKIEKNFNVKKIALIRDSIDVCLSMNADPESFSIYYGSYIDSLIKENVKIYKYEDLVKDSDSFLKNLSFEIGVENKFDLNNFRSYPATGDNKYKYLSRGQRSNTISKQKRRRVNKDLIKKINSCKKIKEINKKNNYPTNYYDNSLETSKEIFIDRLYRTYYKILKTLGS